MGVSTPRGRRQTLVLGALFCQGAGQHAHLSPGQQCRAAWGISMAEAASARSWRCPLSLIGSSRQTDVGETRQRGPRIAGERLPGVPFCLTPLVGCTVVTRQPLVILVGGPRTAPCCEPEAGLTGPPSLAADSPSVRAEATCPALRRLRGTPTPEPPRSAEALALQALNSFPGPPRLGPRRSCPRRPEEARPGGRVHAARRLHHPQGGPQPLTWASPAGPSNLVPQTPGVHSPQCSREVSVKMIPCCVRKSTPTPGGGTYRQARPQTRAQSCRGFEWGWGCASRT